MSLCISQTMSLLLVTSSSSLPSIVTNHLHPLFHFLQVKLSLWSVGHPEVRGQTWGARGSRPFLCLADTLFDLVHVIPVLSTSAFPSVKKWIIIFASLGCIYA